MPPLETTGRFQTAVLWELKSHDSHGRPTVYDPVEIKVEWNARTSRNRSNQTSSQGVEATVVVDRKIALGSVMWLGKLVDWKGVRPDSDSEEVMQVVEYHRTPDIRGREVRQTVELTRFREAWPPSTSVDLLVDRTLSHVEYNKTEALPDAEDEVVIYLELYNSSEEPIVDREVYAGLSSQDSIALDNSPQTTDSNGIAMLRIRAGAEVSVYADPYTDLDGTLGTRTLLTFVDS